MELSVIGEGWWLKNKSAEQLGPALWFVDVMWRLAGFSPAEVSQIGVIDRGAL
jgi:hypothetical protein